MSQYGKVKYGLKHVALLERGYKLKQLLCLPGATVDVHKPVSAYMVALQNLQGIPW